jgi:hypothetical protein
MNFSLRNWEGYYYAYSKRVGGKIVSTYRCKNPPIHTPCDLHRLVHHKFCLVLYPWVGDIPKMQDQTQQLLCPRPLILRMLPP